MSQKPNISGSDTLSFLKEKLGNTVSDLTLLSGGDWSQAYSFLKYGKKYVLRWSKSAEAFEKDSFATSFVSAFIPVPKIVDWGRQFDVFYAISEFVDGIFLEKLTPSQLEATIPSLFQLFDALRNADLSNTTGYGGWDKDGKGSRKSWKEYLLDIRNDLADKQDHDWYPELARSSVGTEGFNSLYQQMKVLVDKCPEDRQLIHADLLNSNLMIAGNKIGAVIDWQCSMYGDSLYEIAWFMYCRQYFPHFDDIQLCQKAIDHYKSTTANTTNLEERILCYQIHIGLGAVAYNSFKKDWTTAEKELDYTTNIVRNAKKLISM